MHSVFCFQQVRTWKMHLFTAIQVLCLAMLWGVKSSPAALAFPFILIMMIPIRKFLLPKIFSAKELNHLDQSGASKDDDKDDDDDLDFYEEARMANIKNGKNNNYKET